MALLSRVRWLVADRTVSWFSALDSFHQAESKALRYVKQLLNLGVEHTEKPPWISPIPPERHWLSYRSEHLEVVWQRSFLKNAGPVSMYPILLYKRVCRIPGVAPTTSPKFTVLCVTKDLFHPSHLVPSMPSGSLLNHWVVDLEWLLKDYPRQGKSLTGLSATVGNELLIPAASHQASRWGPRCWQIPLTLKLQKSPSAWFSFIHSEKSLKLWIMSLLSPIKY